jgi:FAD/FMN-containing dehydrogenase
MPGPVEDGKRAIRALREFGTPLVDLVGPTLYVDHQSSIDDTVPHRAGVYVNFLDSDDDTSRVREAYGDDTYRRLAEVKAKYDPENVFHHNKNIQPSTPAQ